MISCQWLTPLVKFSVPHGRPWWILYVCLHQVTLSIETCAHAISIRCICAFETKMLSLMTTLILLIKCLSGRCGSDFKTCIISKLTIQTISLGTRCEIALRWQPNNLTYKKATVVQTMAWCHQATSHYLSRWLHTYMSPHGVTVHDELMVKMKNNVTHVVY